MSKGRIEDPISTAWADSNVASVSLRLLREEFLAMPLARQEERRTHVRALLIKERLRGQKSPSYLMRHAKEIYGD